MKTNNVKTAPIANGKDRLLDGFLMCAMALLVMHATSGGTVEVPMADSAVTVSADQAPERSAEEISAAFQVML
jgi:hypothetical protein